MAITRAQQFRQMLEDGGMLVQPSTTGKRPGYRGDAAYRSKSAQSSPSAGGQGNVGSKASFGGSDKSSSESFKDPRDRSGTGTDTVPTKEVRKKEKAKYNQQFLSKGKAPPGPNRKKVQRYLDYINKDMLINYGRFSKPPTSMLSPTGYPNYGIPNIYSLIEEAIESGADLNDIKEFANKIPVGKSGTSYEMNPVPDLDIDSIRELVGAQTTQQGSSITGYQKNAIEDIKKGINARNELVNEGMTQERFEELYPGPPKPKDDAGPEDPCLGPNPPAYCFIGQRAETPPEDPIFTPSFRFMNRGGMVEDAPMGGIMDLESTRQMLFIGGIAKGIKKGLKSVTRGLKKVAKSPLGKAALLGTIGYGLGGGTFFGKTLPGVGTSGGFSFKNILPNILGAKGDNEFGGFPGIFGLDGKISKGLGVFGLSGLGGALLASLENKDNDDFNIEEYYKMAGIDIPQNQYRFLAEGGDVEPVAKKTMPLLDMDGQEMDFRQEGGFVPIGRMEKADDVPARLSKNEFVFTADAVRNAGGGDVDKGAEVMYNTMKNLEAGGEVSEETQGLEGAKQMFQTSQRLGEVV